jgi:capsular polysaccharide biosynthesis protein
MKPVKLRSHLDAGDAADVAVAPRPLTPRDMAEALWRGRAVIAVGAIVLALAGAASTVVRPRQYEATATLAVYAARLAEQAQQAAPPESLVPLIASPTLASRVVQELGLDRPPGSYTAATLFDGPVVVRAVPQSSLIKIVARFEDADLASRVSNRLAELGVDAVAAAGRVDVTAVERELKAMLEAADARRLDAERQYEEYRSGAQVELVEKEVATLLGQRAALMDASVRLEAERARLARLEGELAGRDRLLSLRQSIVDDPAMAEVARGVAPERRDLLGLEVRSDAQDPVYSGIDAQVALSRGLVASLEQEVARLTSSVGPGGTPLQRLSQLYERQSQLERLDSERRLAAKAYDDVASRYMGARLASIGRLPQLAMVDPAMVPDAPMGRYLARNVFLGLVSGALLAGAWLMIRLALVTGAGR